MKKANMKSKEAIVKEWLVKKRFGDYSLIGMLNMLVLQWLFIRVRVSMSSLPGFKLITFDVIGPIVPLTGWWNNYVWLRRK